jgi:hypothetical protein
MTDVNGPGTRTATACQRRIGSYREITERARAEGLTPTDEGDPLRQLTKMVIEGGHPGRRYG